MFIDVDVKMKLEFNLHNFNTAILFLYYEKLIGDNFTQSTYLVPLKMTSFSKLKLKLSRLFRIT